MQPTQDANPAGGIQFDHAEFGESPHTGTTCTACKQAVGARYYAVASNVICAGCRESLQAAMTGGSGAWRFTRALALGMPAAALGSLIYYGIRELTGYEIGLVSIVIGILVGGAVRRGSDRRGGWMYQTLAVGLTYCAIVATYVPPMIQAVREARSHHAAQAAEPKDEAAMPDPVADPENPADTTTVTATSAFIALAILGGIVLAAPFLAGAQNLIGLFIIGIGLYEAWKMNKRPNVQITGPYDLASANGPAAANRAG